MGAELIFARDLNVDLKRTGGVAVATVGLEVHVEVSSQKSALPPLATTPLLPPHTELLCWRTLPGNSQPHCSLLRSFLPPHNGRHICRRHRRRSVRQRCCGRCLRGGEAS